ncbi:MAG: S-layer homology domain-containing protein [Clostridia bacterium]|nr:S-layer homology domain-containing protein [Clostridia bacterium]
MKKKLISLICAFIFIISGTVFHSFASDESILTAVVSYDPESSTVTVKGNAEGTIILYIPSLSQNDGSIIIKQLNANGTYMYSFTMSPDAKSGKYTVYVTSESSSAGDTFNYMDKKKAESGLEIINQKTTLTEFTIAIEEYATDLGINTEDALYLKNKDEIYSLLFTLKRASTPVDFNNAFYMVYAICGLPGSDRNTIEQLLNKYSTQLSIDFRKDYATDERLDENAKTNLCNLLSSYNYKENLKTKSFSAIFNELKPISCIQSALSWQKLKKVLTEDFDFSFVNSNISYNSLRDKDRVFQLMMQGSFDTLQKAEQLFSDCVVVAFNEENRTFIPSGGGGGPSGGGGSSYGGSSAVTVPSPAPAPLKPAFTDINNEHWAYRAVELLYTEGAVNGYENNMFYPDNNVTRAEFTKMILFIADNGNAESQNTYSDIKNTDWFYPYVTKADALGIIKGSGNKFMPEDNITREDAAVIAYRCLNLRGKELSGNLTFNDSDEISDYAKEAIGALSYSKLLNGSGNNMYLPKNNLNRAEAAQIICNLFEYLKDGK